MIIRADQEIKSHRRHLDAFLVVAHSLGVSLRVRVQDKRQVGMDFLAGGRKEDSTTKAARSFRKDFATSKS